jgi:hypothetical protein
MRRDNANRARLAASEQRTIHRSPLFVWLPVFVVGLLCCNAIWEIVRLNIPTVSGMGWPYRLSLLPLDTTVSLGAAIGALGLARAQFAMTKRPSIGFALDPADYWSLRLHNGGPGVAIISSIDYRLALLHDEPELVDMSNWIPAEEVRRVLLRHAFREGPDFQLRWLGSGAPLGVTARNDESLLLAKIGSRVVKRIAEFDVRVRVMDIVGDGHERSFSSSELRKRWSPPDDV